MSRPQIQVRRLSPEHHEDFVVLWRNARAEAGSALEATVVGEDRVRQALRTEHYRVYLALIDARPVGFMVLDQTSLFSFTDADCVCVDQLYVMPEARRNGVARALLIAAATYADLMGAEQVATSVPAQSRDTNRFFARLGFTPLVVRRVASTVALHRKLAPDGERKLLDTALLHRRRSNRARAIRASALMR